MRAALVVLLLASSGANAQEQSKVYRGVHDSGFAIVLRTFEKPCTSEKVLRHLPNHRGRLKAARLTWDGKTYESCWIEHLGKVYSVDEKGEPLVPGIPRALFRDESI